MFQKLFAKLKPKKITSTRNDHNGGSVKRFFDYFRCGFKIRRGLRKPGQQQPPTTTIDKHGPFEQRKSQYITCDKDMDLLDELIIAAASSYSNNSPVLRVGADESASRTTKSGTSVTSRSSSSFMQDNLEAQTSGLETIQPFFSSSSFNGPFLKKPKSLEGMEWFRNEDRKLAMNKLVDQIDETINLYNNNISATTTTTHSSPSSPPLPVVAPLRIKAPELRNLTPISLDSPSHDNLQPGLQHGSSFTDWYRNLEIQEIMDEIDTAARLFHPKYFATTQSGEPAEPTRHTLSPDHSEIEHLQIPKYHHNKTKKVQAASEFNKLKTGVKNNSEIYNNNNNNNNNNNSSVVAPSAKRVKKPFINYTDECDRGKASPPLISRPGHKTPSIQTILTDFWSDLAQYISGQRQRIPVTT
ncbi:hypothetical protein V1514DRAFT_370414 [Lipomyces japonicus]|uniref:uncharacterized protein n=1 Tax=Lipomyces japonicus TaxID=56871 RepID=UPI0034CFFA06